MTTKTIGILSASIRENGNNTGLLSFINNILKPVTTASDSIKVVQLDPYALNLGPILDPVISQGVKDPSKYKFENTREWSKSVAACDAFIVVSPQYNWGIPGSFKTVLDHLFWEWKGKPCTIVTYGGHGGTKCHAHLVEVLGGGFKMNLVGGAKITLPEEYIKGEKRVGKGEDDWLKEYEADVRESFDKLVAAL
ncbi:flavoprotein [Meredithblackwellia eburnea MCA 4105]